MTRINYTLGPVGTLAELYPPHEQMTLMDDPPRTLADVIRWFTAKSLHEDDLHINDLSVAEADGHIQVTIDSDHPDAIEVFARRQREVFGPGAGAKAIEGKRLLEAFGVWNPMAGYPVNDSKTDGDCKWHLFLPLGLNLTGQKGVLLMHYPPWQVLQQGDFLNCMTMHRWNTVLRAAGVPEEEIRFFRTIVDVNPIAAPGSGQSEYPNDYFPIMMASAFFHGSDERDYIRSMLELYLNPPGHSGTHTLPLLVCGSPLYDPQAPGWFRATYKDQIPPNPDTGEIPIDVLQAGDVRLRENSERLTPYMVGNHMIAAGVTGRCTDDPGKIPDIRKYEAQDLVAASFLWYCAQDPSLSAEEAKKKACQRYFQNDTGEGAPNPKDPDDALAICALAQMDLYFCPKPLPHPKYSWETALKRCRERSTDANPCCKGIGPNPPGSKTDPDDTPCGDHSL